MSAGDCFLGEIKWVSFNFAPKGWAMCNGQLLAINQNQALFALFGTFYGGDGRTTFALPNLRGRVPIHFGHGFTVGQVGGEEVHNLTSSEMPQHFHFANATSNDATTPIPSGNLLAKAAPANPYIAPSNLGALNAATIANTGGSQAHENREPFLVVNAIVALQGIFPSQN